MQVKDIIFVFIAIFLAGFRCHSQQSTFFSAPQTACLTESVLLKNESTSTTNYVWDFCQNALEQPPFVKPVSTLSASLPLGIKMALSRGKWYGFVANREGGLLRLEFGSDPNSTPQTIDLGNLNLLRGPTEIALIQENGNWFGLVGNYYGSNLVRLTFGTDLANLPIAEDLGNFGGWSQIYGVDVVKDGVNTRALVTSFVNNSVSLVDFKTSITNNPTSADVMTYVNPLISSPIKVKLQLQNANWFALVTSFGNDALVRISFGADLFNTPSFSIVSSLVQPSGLDFVQDGNLSIAIVGSLSGPLVRLNFGSNVSLSPTQTNLSGSLGATYGVSMLKTWPNWSVFAVDALGNKFNRLDFFDTCDDVSIKTSTAFEPAVSYNSPGNKVIELLGISSSGENEASQTISVLNLTSPSIAFNYDNICVNSPITFVGGEQTSLGINSWGWSFGNGATSSSNPTSYTFSSIGTYPTTLSVTASNGCRNAISKSIQIFNAPQANFSLPAISPLCTNQLLAFSNTTPSIGTTINWQWSINGSNVSTAQNLSSSFSSTDPQTINLQASIPGCSTSFSQTISSLVQGPLANFTSPATGCQQSTMNFTNTTSGSVTGYSWSFGDGNTANTTNCINTYSNIGTYQVTLQASNAAGCQNTATKSITIYSKPQPDFSIGLPPFSCAGSPSQFTDQTPAPTDSNIAAWQWAFGDPASGTSTTRNPTYIYSTAGTYNVSLAATTNFGCTGFIQKAVTISVSPQAAFSNSVACVSQPTQFTDASSGSIRSRLWTIQGNSFTTPNVQFAFVTSGSYPVLLTVTGTNNCTSQAVKNIVVPVLPTLDFSVQAACNTNPTLFSEITTGADAPLSQIWNFASLGTGTGATTQFTFSTLGNYAVQLRSTRQSGCVYSITKNISVIQGPVADFTPSVDVGGPPLPVNFVNTSTGASSYLWRFGDTANTTSTVVSPNFTFNELGVYAVKLTASNTAGCAFTTSKPITVLVPNINVILSEFRATPDGNGILQPTVSIVNNGNLPVSNPDLLLDVASAGLVRKKLLARILPNQTMSVPVDLQIVARSAGYICAELVVPNNTADFDKRRCLPLGSDEILFAPYPNPAADILNFDWVSTQAKPVSVMVFSPGGSEVFRQQFESIAAGLNRLQIKTTELPNGLYYILYSDGTTTKSFSFAVAKN